MKSATRWVGLGLLLFALSTGSAFGQRVRFGSAPGEGSTVTIAQAPTGGAPGSSVYSPQQGTSTTTPSYNSAGTGASGANAPTPTYNNTNSAAPGGTTYGNGGSVLPPYNPNPASAPGPTYGAPAMAPTAALGGGITAPSPQWDPYASPGPVYGQPSLSGGPGPGCPSPCIPVQACPNYPWHFWGDFLYLKPRNTDVAYAIPINAFGVQSGPAAILNPDYTPAFRVGISRDLFDATSSLGIQYTRFQSRDNNSISVTAPNSIVPLATAVQPLFNVLNASGTYDLDFDLADLDYRGLLASGNRYTVNYLIGARYARLKEASSAVYSTGAFQEAVQNQIDFNGGGIRIGLEGERYAARTGLMVYGRTSASFIGGGFRARYQQIQNSTLTLADTNWTVNRVVPILEMELGVGWVSPTGTFRVSGGYLFNAWYNVLRTTDFVNAVQSGAFTANGDTITFDGLVVRGELRF